MKKIDGAVVKTQHFIEEQNIKDLINNLSNRLTIKELAWEGWNKSSWSKLYVSEELKKLGVTYARETGMRKNVAGVFRNVGRKKMLESLNKIIKKYDVETMQVRRMVLTLDGKHSTIFSRTKKDIRLPNDRRRKMTIFGLVGIVGEHAMKVLEEVSAKKIACQFIKIETHQVVCSEIK